MGAGVCTTSSPGHRSSMLVVVICTSMILFKPSTYRSICAHLFDVTPLIHGHLFHYGSHTASFMDRFGVWASGPGSGEALLYTWPVMVSMVDRVGT